MFDLSNRLKLARQKQATEALARAIVAGELVRDVAKETLSAGDRKAHDLAITAKLAIEDLRESLEGKVK